MFSTISARRIVRPLPPFASPLNLMHTDAHRSAKCRDCRVARNLSPVSHWCVCDLSNSCPFCTLHLELCVPDPESKRNIKEMCNAFSDGRSVFCLRVHTSKCCKMDWPQIDANWDKRQPSEAWQCTESTLRVVRKMLQWCTNETWKAGVDKSRAKVRASGLKLHVSSSATLGRVFWPNADLGTFTKFSRGNSRTFNQVVPKLCWAKCTHRHRCPHPILKLW